MVEESKENLLKILTNAPEETPGQNISNFEYVGMVYGEEYDTNHAISFDQLQYEGYSMGLNGDTGTADIGGYIYLYDPDGKLIMKKKPVYKGVEVDLISIDIDDSGNLYGIFVYQDMWHLGYFNNICKQTADGEYDITLKIAYSLQDVWNNITSTLGSSGTVYDTDIKKNPTAGQFLITLAFNNSNSNYTLINILYNVNVGSSNTFEYKYKFIGSHGFNFIKNMEVTWGNSASFSALIMSRDYNGYTAEGVPVQFYKVTGNFANQNAPTATLIYTENSYFFTGYGAYGTFTEPKNAAQKDGAIYFCSSHVSGEDITITIFKYDTSVKTIWSKSGKTRPNSGAVNKCNIIKINNQIFAWSSISNTTGYTDNSSYILHIVGNTYTEEAVADHMPYAVGIVGIIQNIFNLYKIYLFVYGTTRFDLTYRYSPSSYNGEPYFSKESVTSNRLTLYGVNSIGTGAIFDRNLYNKTLLGNEINSITQIPFNYLNDTPIIGEELISRTNSTIDSDSREIEKNQYEELYINNIDSFKVFDRNNGSTYNQKSSLEVAKNIFDGFIENYTITKYRVNKKNGTYIDYEIQEITRNGNTADIGIYFYNTGVDNIELYDNSMTAPFVRIDVSNLMLNRLYRVVQKIKVE